MKVKDLIKELSRLSEEKQDKDICIIAENGLLLEPCIKFKLKNEYDVINQSTENIEKIVLTWE